MMTMKSATISPCGKYRYTLDRSWDEQLPRLLWVMLNPSTADAEVDDPTIRRVIEFSRTFGYGSARVVNLFEFRSVKPVHLKSAEDPIGPDNETLIEGSLPGCAAAIVAWGANGIWCQANAVLRILNRRFPQVTCLGVTNEGHPRHPLYIRRDAERVPFIAPWERGS